MCSEHSQCVQFCADGGLYMFTHQKSVGKRDAKYLQGCDPLHVRENRRQTKQCSLHFIVTVTLGIAMSTDLFQSPGHATMSIIMLHNMQKECATISLFNLLSSAGKSSEPELYHTGVF